MEGQNNLTAVLKAVDELVLVRVTNLCMYMLNYRANSVPIDLILQEERSIPTPGKGGMEF